MRILKKLILFSCEFMLLLFFVLGFRNFLTTWLDAPFYLSVIVTWFVGTSLLSIIFWGNRK